MNTQGNNDKIPREEIRYACGFWVEPGRNRFNRGITGDSGYLLLYLAASIAVLFFGAYFLLPHALGPAATALTCRGRYTSAFLVGNLDHALWPVLLTILAGILIRKKGNSARAPVGAFYPGFALGLSAIALFLVFIESGAKLFPSQNRIIFLAGPGGFLLLIPLFLSGFLEEFRYRGYVQNQIVALLGPGFAEKIGAVLLASVAFAACRYPYLSVGPEGGGLAGFLKTAALGLLLGFAYEMSGSLWAVSILNTWSSAYGIFIPTGSLVYAWGPFLLFFVVAAVFNRLEGRSARRTFEMSETQGVSVLKDKADASDVSDLKT